MNSKDGRYAAGVYRSWYVGFDNRRHWQGKSPHMSEEETNDGTVAQEAMAKFTIEKVFTRHYVAIDNKY